MYEVIAPELLILLYLFNVTPVFICSTTNKSRAHTIVVDLEWPNPDSTLEQDQVKKVTNFYVSSSYLL